MELKKTHRDFRATYAMTERKLAIVRHLDALWWFMENVDAEDPARDEIYWELRQQSAAITSAGRRRGIGREA